MRQVYFHKPSPDILRPFLAEQAELDFNYAAVGATADTPPSGYNVDRTTIALGSGESVFRAAQAALQRWQQFQLGWVEAWSPGTALETGQSVAVMARAFGCWWLNACRVVYMVNKTGEHATYGFAYGTLPGHVESGEESFLIRWDQESNQVCYDILAFSRPNHILARLGYPLVRRRQKRFARDSAMAMFRAVRPDSPIPTFTQTTD